MSQQYDIAHGQPQQRTQTAQQPGTTDRTGTGGQLGGQQGDAGRLPQQYRRVLDAVAQSVAVAGWCADQCIGYADPNMVECVRRCEDVVEIGEALLAVAPRSSRATADLATTFARAAEACARECGRHGHPHCQECATVLPWAAQSVRELPELGGQQSQQWATQQPQVTPGQFAQEQTW